MSSATIRAQELANESNVQMTQETNQANRDIAHEANEYNRILQEAQNNWNVEQWERENKYNSPAAQVQRYIEAGINPIWAIGSGNPGNAQQLTSAEAKPAEVAQMVAPQVQPEYDNLMPQKIGNILGAVQNVTNSAQGFYKLALESEDVATRRSAQQSAAALAKADIMFKKSQTAGQEILNNLNMRTFETQVSTRVAELNSINSRIANTDSQTELYKVETANAAETKNQIVAMTKYVGVQSDALLESVKQRWQELRIAQQQADTSQYSAYSTSYYQGENLKFEASRLDFERKRFVADLANKSNEQIVSWIKETKGFAERYLGYLDDFYDNKNQTVLDQLSKAGHELQKRFEDNPSEFNAKSYQEYLNAVEGLSSKPVPSPRVNVSRFSVLNPSDSWQ